MRIGSEPTRLALILYIPNVPILGVNTWRGNDCCRWKGVLCSSRTSHVVELDLSSEDYPYNWSLQLHGEMTSSIVTLRHLRYSDITFNDFNGTRIPSFLGTLRNLRYLNLSHANFMESVPSQFGNLSRLQYLDLTASGTGGLYVLDFSWLPRLSSLKIFHI